MDVIIQIIQTLGFPIGCCVFLGWYIKKISDEYREDIRSITDKYDESIKEFRKTLEKYTIVLSSIENRLEKKEG